MMRNAHQQMQQVWTGLPLARRHQVMVLIGRMIQRQLRVQSPHEEQVTHNALDKTETGREHVGREGDDETAHARCLQACPEWLSSALCVT